MFNPSRLKLARQRRQLTARELASSAGLTPEHVSRMETGKAKNIEQSTIAALAQALGYPIQFFFRDDTEVPTKNNVSFRGLRSMTAKERDASLSAGALAYLLSDWIESRFNLPEADLLDLRHESSPESAAEALRSYWGIGNKPIPNVIKLLESKGVRVFSLSEETKNVDAFSCWRSGTPYVFLNTFKTAERSRFDALHELAHLVLHRHGKPQGREAEVEADKFASQFLIPTEDLLAHIPVVTSMKQLIKLKKRWGSSLSALTYRLHKLNKITDWQYRTYCIQINKRYGKTEPEEMEREQSYIIDSVLKQLWSQRVTKTHIAKDLCVPADELDSVLFNLIGKTLTSEDGILNAPKKLELAL